MHWVLVNYSVKDKIETFYVNEEEERNKKTKSKFKKYVFPIFSFIFAVIKYI